MKSMGVLLNHWQLCMFSFYDSASVSLGNSVIIFGGYDHGGGEHTRESLKQIGKVIIICLYNLYRIEG